MAHIKVPRDHRRTVKAIDSFSELNRWASDVDGTITEILFSLRNTAGKVATVLTPSRGLIVPAHASQHLPSGSDPLPTAAPLSILGGTSTNSTGTANSFARSNHSHSVATAAPTLVFGTTASAGTGNALVRADATLAIFDATLPAALAASGATGAAAFAARGDHVHVFPTSLQSTANLKALTLTDDGANQTLTATFPLILQLAPLGNLLISPDPGSAPSNTMTVQIKPSLGSRTGINSTVFTLGAIAASQTIRCWDATFTALAGTWNSTTIVGFDSSSFSFSPAIGSNATNFIYNARFPGPVVNNNNAGFTDIASLYLGAPRRFTVVVTTLPATVPTLKVECSPLGTGEQAGIHVIQRTAQDTATIRHGIKIDAQNSGTTRRSITAADQIDISAQAGNAQTVLALHQLATGAAAGAHLNFDDKAGDPPTPDTGDVWRNGDRLRFRNSAGSGDLAVNPYSKQYWGTGA